MSYFCRNCLAPLGFGGQCWNSGCGVRMTPALFFRTHTPSNAPPCIPMVRELVEQRRPPAQPAPDYEYGGRDSFSSRISLQPRP